VVGIFQSVLAANNLKSTSSQFLCSGVDEQRPKSYFLSDTILHRALSKQEYLDQKQGKWLIAAKNILLKKDVSAA